MNGGAAAVVAGAVAMLLATPAHGAHGPAYRGEYANAFLAGRTTDGREVMLMAGTHVDFPYHDTGSTYDQVAVHVDGAEPLVLTARPSLRGLAVEPGPERARLAFAGHGLTFTLELASVRHRPRIEGDPAQIGDGLIAAGIDPAESPGFVYTPFELTRLNRGALRLRGERTPLTALHGQLETGHIRAPADPLFQSSYDYLAAPSLDGPPYTYVGFRARALHGGSQGALDGYFRDTASDEFTLADGKLTEGNPRGAPAPFHNRRGLPEAARKLAQWATDLGPGVLTRKLVRASERDGRALALLSETIEEDAGGGVDVRAPVIARATARTARKLTFHLSEDALVYVRRQNGWNAIGDAPAGWTTVALEKRGGRPRLVRAVDEHGNRSRAARVRR